jgi:alanyl-tRNA synthetase
MVIRRAVRFGTKLGFEQPFLANVADSVIDTMRVAYPELDEHRESIRRTVTNEEVRFRRAMDRALSELEDMLVDLTAEVKAYLNELLAPMFKTGQVRLHRKRQPKLSPKSTSCLSIPAWRASSAGW